MKYKKGDKVKVTGGSIYTDDLIEAMKIGLSTIVKVMDENTVQLTNPNYNNPMYGGGWCWETEHITPATKDWDSLEEGDILINKDGDERVILGICGKVYFVSYFDDKEKLSTFASKQDLIERGFTIKQDTEEVKEMTVADVEKLVGGKVKIVK